MSTDELKGQILSDVDAYGDAVATEQKAADQQLVDQANAAASQAQGQVATLTQQLATAQARIAELEAQVGSEEPPPDPDPAKTLFSAYAGPMTTSESGQTSTTRARVAKALGVPVLPADRVYSSTSFGKAIDCPSPLVAVSYGQVPALARGDAAVVQMLTTELTALSKTGKRYDVSADHEVDAKIRKGTYTGAQVKAAAARLAQIVAGIGSPNIRPTMCLTGWVFTLGEADPSHPVHYFDPASVGLIALDPYYVTQKTVGAAFDPAWAWASKQGKPVAVWETGWGTDSNVQSPTDALATTKVNEIIDYWRTRKTEYVLWFESIKGNNLLESHPPALAAWAAAMKS